MAVRIKRIGAVIMAFMVAGSSYTLMKSNKSVSMVVASNEDQDFCGIYEPFPKTNLTVDYNYCDIVKQTNNDSIYYEQQFVYLPNDETSFPPICSQFDGSNMYFEFSRLVKKEDYESIMNLYGINLNDHSNPFLLNITVKQRMNHNDSLITLDRVFQNISKTLERNGIEGEIYGISKLVQQQNENDLLEPSMTYQKVL